MKNPVPVKLTDVIQCHCGHSAPLKSFKFVPWLKFREPGCERAVSGYYYCRCQDGLPLPSGKVKSSALVGKKKRRKIERSERRGFARPIAFRQGGSRKDPRIILSFPPEPDQDEALEPGQALVLETVASF